MMGQSRVRQPNGGNIGVGDEEGKVVIVAVEVGVVDTDGAIDVRFFFWIMRLAFGRFEAVRLIQMRPLS